MKTAYKKTFPQNWNTRAVTIRIRTYLKSHLHIYYFKIEAKSKQTGKMDSPLSFKSLHIYGIGDLLCLSVLHLGSVSLIAFLIVESVSVSLRGGRQFLYGRKPDYFLAKLRYSSKISCSGIRPQVISPNCVPSPYMHWPIPTVPFPPPQFPINLTCTYPSLNSQYITVLRIYILNITVISYVGQCNTQSTHHFINSTDLKHT